MTGLAAPGTRSIRPALKLKLAVLALLSIGANANAAPQHGTRFWNLTGETITHLYLAPAGTAKWGADQTRNDPDGSVDDDERLAITGIASGHYDARLTQKAGRVCTVRNIEIRSGAVFSIDKKALTGCGR